MGVTSFAGTDGMPGYDRFSGFSFSRGRGSQHTGRAYL